MIKKKHLLLLYFLSLMIVQSCQQQLPRDSATETPTPDPPSPEVTRESTTAHTLQPSATLPATIIPTLAPTYSPAEAQLLVGELLFYNSGCRLPCWWGFIPGKTSWQTAYDFLARIAKEIYIPFEPEESDIFADVILSAPEDISSYDLTHVYRVRDGVISMIEVDPGRIPAYSIDSILTSYGAPSEVWIWTFRENWQEFFPFDLVLFYPEQGIMVRFDTDAKKIGSRVQGCFQDEIALIMALWSSETQMSFIDVASLTSNIDLREWGEPISVMEATGLELDAFYQLFKNPSNTLCLETEADLWRPP
jgi:hypothetical protein